jgi:hypothetical protein
MNRIVLALVIVVLFAAGAMAAAFPTVSAIGPTAPYATVNQTASQITMSSYPVPAGNPPSGVPAIAAAGASPIGNDYVLSTKLHFDPSNPTELGLVARAAGDVAALYLVSLNSTSNEYSGYLAMRRVGFDMSAETYAAMPIAGFDINKDYTLVFNVKGPSLTTALYDGTIQVGGLSTSQSDLTNGGIGVFANYQTAGGPYLSGTFLQPTVNAILEGDANLSGKTDVADLTLLLNNYNQPGKTWLNGDFTGDGTVNVADLTLLLNNYNKTFGAVAAASTAVPEPGSLAMLAGIALTALLCWWRKRA